MANCTKCAVEVTADNTFPSHRYICKPCLRERDAGYKKAARKRAEVKAKRDEYRKAWRNLQVRTETFTEFAEMAKERGVTYDAMMRSLLDTDREMRTNARRTDHIVSMYAEAIRPTAAPAQIAPTKRNFLARLFSL